MFEVDIILKRSIYIYSLLYVSKKQKQISDDKMGTCPYGLRLTNLTYSFMDCLLLTIKARMNSQDIFQILIFLHYLLYFHYLS